MRFWRLMIVIEIKKIKLHFKFLQRKLLKEFIINSKAMKICLIILLNSWEVVSKVIKTRKVPLIQLFQQAQAEYKVLPKAQLECLVQLEVFKIIINWRTLTAIIE